MTASTSFVASGPAAIGFETRPSSSRNPFKFGALAVGHDVGVYGATDDALGQIPPAAP